MGNQSVQVEAGTDTGWLTAVGKAPIPRGTQQEWSSYENYFDWRKRKDRRTGSKGIGGYWPGDSQGRANSGDFQVEIENRESVRKLYQAVSSFDAVALAAGQVAFAPLSELTAEKWEFSLGSNLMGQINLVQEAIPFIKEKGSFTLVSGILNDDPIFAGVAASTVSGALEAFVRAAAIELPKGLRINVVSPTMLKESESQFAQFFLGMIPVEGWKVGQAYKRAILGAQTGRVYKVD